MENVRSMIRDASEKKYVVLLRREVKRTEEVVYSHTNPLKFCGSLLFGVGNEF